MDQQAKRKLAAILFSDIVGYSAMMQRNQTEAVATVEAYKEVLEEKVSRFNGEVLHYYGDGSLCIFSSATDALRCAKEIQQQFRDAPAVPLRIGIHVGEILFQNGQPFGDGVNIASRIESIGQVGTVFFSRNVYEKVRNLPEFEIAKLGQFEFKNIEMPMQVYALANEGFPVPNPEQLSGKLKEKTDAPKRRVNVWTMALAAALLFALVYMGMKSMNPPAQTGADADGNGIKSIAVLPFDDFSTNEEHSFFAEAIADEIRSQLLSVNGLKVVSGYSSKYYKGQNFSLQKVGEELEVEYILQGKVQRLANSVKVGVELSNTQTHNLEWSPSPFERNMEDIFMLENDIARQIVTQLRVRLTTNEKQELETLPTDNPEAYQLFLKGQELMHRNRANIGELTQAMELFKQATDLDPEFDRAHLALAEGYMEYALWGRISSKEGAEMALNSIFKVSDDRSAEYVGILGAINFNRREKVLAKKFLERSLEMNSNYLLAQIRLAWIKNNEGNNEEAIALVDAAHAVNPKDPIYFGYMGLIYYYSRKFEEGIAIVQKGLDNHPKDNFLKWVSGYLYSGNGDYEKAVNTFTNRSVARQTNWMIGYCYGILGQTEKAQWVLEYLLNRRKEGHVPAHMIASVYIGLGDYEKALDWLEIDVEEGGHEHFYWGITQDIKYDPLRDMDRFKALLERI